MSTQPQLAIIGNVWKNAPTVNRYSGPHADSTTVIDTIHANQSVTVVCYAHGDTESFANPVTGNTTSDAWDFVVTGNEDPGGFVNDVFINTGGDIHNQLPTCTIILERMQRMSSV